MEIKDGIRFSVCIVFSIALLSIQFIYRMYIRKSRLFLRILRFEAIVKKVTMLIDCRMTKNSR